MDGMQFLQEQKIVAVLKLLFHLSNGYGEVVLLVATGPVDKRAIL